MLLPSGVYSWGGPGEREKLSFVESLNGILSMHLPFLLVLASYGEQEKRTK